MVGLAVSSDRIAASMPALDPSEDLIDPDYCIHICRHIITSSNQPVMENSMHYHSSAVRDQDLARFVPVWKPHSFKVLRIILSILVLVVLVVSVGLAVCVPWRY